MWFTKGGSFMKRLLVLFIFSFSIFSALSQSSSRSYPLNFGIWSCYNGNFVSENLKFYSLTDLLVGSASQDKFGSGWGFGGIINVPIFKNFAFSGRLGFNAFSSNLNFILYDYNNGSYLIYVDALKISLSYLEITPSIQFFPMIRKFENLHLIGGLEIGSFITKDFTNLQGITQELQTVKTRLAVVLGAGYIIPLSQNVYLTPEISYRLPLTKVYDDTFTNVDGYHTEALSFSQLRFGLNLTFSISKGSSPKQPELYPAEVGFKEVVTLDKDNKLAPVTQIKVEDIRYQEYFPIVPYIFFEENSSTLLPETQVLSTFAETGEFNPQALPFDALEINRRTLDIVGWRMKNNPQSDLTVTGTIDNSVREKENKQLALERANFVKNYLTKYWNINPQRINTRTTGLPSKPSTSSVPEGVAENRRAELSSSNPVILAPLLIEGDNQRFAEPWQIQFVPYANVYDSFAFWEIDVYQGDNLLKRINGSGQPQILNWTIKPNELMASNVPVDYSLIVETLGGKRYTAKGSIPTEYISQRRKKTEDRPDQTITKFSLVLFDFDKADVSPQDQEIINRLIIPAIKFNSTVKIYGYTDRIGDDEYNLKLATRRAEAVKSIIQKARKDVKIEIYGVGERQLLFDNETPTGRHLSRTVQVIIVTPK